MSSFKNWKTGVCWFEAATYKLEAQVSLYRSPDINKSS